ncbi:MAG: phosphatidylcholine/phosphatidylserine synthase [Gammaproteobacteria bacterium]
MREIRVRSFIPNLITLTGLCFGLSSIRFAFFEEFKASLICILIAGVCDALDGLFSRILKTQSELGAELDSLADFLSFGVAPGILLYLGVLSSLEIWGYVAVTAYIIFACIRLAVFNLSLSSGSQASSKGYFMGVPTPAGAGLMLLPLIHTFLGFDWGLANPHLVAIYTGFVGLLLVSRIPTFSLKQLNPSIKRRFYLRFFFLFVLIVLMLINFLWQFISIIGIVYLISIPVSAITFKRNN